MVTGPMQFGADNNAGPDRTILRAQVPETPNIVTATLVVRNEGASSGEGIVVEAGGAGDGVRATGAAGPDFSGVVARGYTGVVGRANGDGSGVFGSSPVGNGVFGHSSQRNGVEGHSNSQIASGVYGENNGGGYGIAGRTQSGDNAVAAVLGESTGTSPAGHATGVYGYSENGYGGKFVTAQTGNAPFANSGGLRVVGPIVKSDGEYTEALPHPDGSQRLLYAPLSPESWYEDFGRAELVSGQAEVELDADFLAVLGIEDGSYHVFLAAEGETGGLYVSSRDARAFTVREQQGGTSSATFSYRVVAKNKHREPDRLARLQEPAELTDQPRLLPPAALPPERRTPANG
jgi:hypothetical protein